MSVPIEIVAAVVRPVLAAMLRAGFTAVVDAVERGYFHAADRQADDVAADVVSRCGALGDRRARGDRRVETPAGRPGSTSLACPGSGPGGVSASRPPAGNKTADGRPGWGGGPPLTPAVSPRRADTRLHDEFARLVGTDPYVAREHRVAAVVAHVSLNEFRVDTQLLHERIRARSPAAPTLRRRVDGPLGAGQPRGSYAAAPGSGSWRATLGALRR
jgi:hypothetical protein